MDIKQKISLQAYNTFGIDVLAEKFLEIHSFNDLKLAFEAGIFKENVLILGGGSNILLTSDFKGFVVKNYLRGIAIVEKTDDFILVKAASGEIWHELVLFCVNNQFAGIENLSLIPGTVGAAPMQNIGAYGVELIDVFESLTAMDLETGEMKIFTKNECAFNYRSSVFKTVFKGKYFITDVTFRLTVVPIIKINYGAIQEVLASKNIEFPNIRDVSDAVIEIRQNKLPDPKILGNAGSFFKNPEITDVQFEALKKVYTTIPGYPTTPGFTKVPAGWLIEQCGWKGKQVGNTGAHKNQALVLVNYGNATGAEIMELALAIQQSVQEKFGITIIPEVNVIT